MTTKIYPIKWTAKSVETRFADTRKGLRIGDSIINWTPRKERKVEQFMKRAIYDKQFKMSAVKLAQSADQSVTEVAK